MVIDSVYKMDDNRIREIIREEVDALDFFKGINSSHGLTPWNDETKMARMKPTNAACSQGSVPTREFKIHSYQDWIKNYKPQGISYGEYIKMEV